MRRAADEMHGDEVIGRKHRSDLDLEIRKRRPEARDALAELVVRDQLGRLGLAIACEDLGEVSLDNLLWVLGHPRLRVDGLDATRVSPPLDERWMRLR